MKVFSVFISLLFLFFVPLVASAHSDIVVVVMNKDGFEPSEVTVDENSAVLFVNQDEDPRWPASNIHPTHDLYSDFDPKQPIEVGKSWAFRPKPGIWKFHDHLKPHMRGVLTVNCETEGLSAGESLIVRIKKALVSFFETVSKSLKNLFNKKSSTDFKKLSSDEQFDYLEQLAIERGAKEPWEFLEKNFAGEAGTSGNIHDLAHFVGKVMYEKGGIDALKNCKTTFAFGCYHGFLDSAFTQSLDYLKEAQEACLALGPVLTGPNASCIHGIGHGVASFYNTTDLNSSLKTCESLGESAQFCYDGVFMEFGRSAPAFYKESEPLYPCSEIDQKYMFACGRNQPTILIDRFRFTLTRVIEICEESQNTDFKQACFDNIGFTLARQHHGEVEKISQGCSEVETSQYRVRCIKASAGELIFQDTPGWQEKAPRLCDSLKAKDRSDCLEYLQKLQNEYDR